MNVTDREPRSNRPSLERHPQALRLLTFRNDQARDGTQE